MKEWVKPVAIAGSACVLLLGALGGGMWWMLKAPRKPVLEKPVDVAKFIASPEFDKLKYADRKEYLSKLPQGPEMREALKDLDESARRAVFEKSIQVREAERKKTVREYFKLPPEQREAWMANYVAQEDKRRAEMRERIEQLRKEGKLPEGAGGWGGQRRGGQQGGGQGGPPPQ